jgi:hypothetical protein
MSPLFLILLVDMAVKAAVPETLVFDLDRLAGNYEQPASRCPVTTVAGEFCAPRAMDRLVIQKLGAENARIVVHSHQNGDHECHLDGVANLRGTGLQYCLEYEPGTCVTLTQDADHLKLKVTLDGNYYVPFCGSRATLDGLTFDKRSHLSPQPCQKSP